MKVLKIIEEQNDLFLRIEKDNKILIESEKGYRNLYLQLRRIINDKSSSTKGYIDNKEITSKEFRIINLMSYDCIIDELDYKKESLFYEYIESILKSNIEQISDKLNETIYSLLEKIVISSDIDFNYELNNDCIKTLQNITNYKIKSKNMDEVFLISQIIKQLLSKGTGPNLMKYFIFYNSNFLKFDFSKYDMCYSFDIGNNCSFEEYNLISTSNNIKEFEYERIISELRAWWPIPYSNFVIEKLAKKYFSQFLILETIELENQDEVIVAYLLGKILNLNKKLFYSKANIDNNVQSFLTNL